MVFWQEAPARHGLFTHSLMSISQVCPGGGEGGAAGLASAHGAPPARPPRAGPPPPQDDPLGASGEEGALQRAAPPDLGAKRETDLQAWEGLAAHWLIPQRRGLTSKRCLKSPSLPPPSPPLESPCQPVAPKPLRAYPHPRPPAPWTHPASLRGRHRRSSRNPLTPDTRRRFCRARGHTGPAPPHTWPLGGRGRTVNAAGAPAGGQRPGHVLTEATAATVNGWI